MEISDGVRNVVEIGLGLLYLMGAIFNALYTSRHGEEFFGSFARGTMIAPLQALINRIVIPNSRLFALLLAGFLMLVGASILSRGALVPYGLYAGALFCIFGAAASNLGGALANLVLAAAQLLLAGTR